MSGAWEVCVAGSLNQDVVLRLAAHPAPGETVLARSIARHVGGKGANQAVAAARAGARTRLIGRVGADAAGDWLTEALAAWGVDMARVGRDPAAPTGQAFITVDDAGENRIVVAAGANAAFAPADLEAGDLAATRVLLATLETALAPIEALFAAAPSGCLKILNAAPVRPEARGLVDACDLLIVNQPELASLAGLEAAPEALDDLAAAVARLAARRASTVIVTLGADGAAVIAAGEAFHVPGRTVPVVDTVGAGDCFCGVLAAGLGVGMPLRDAVARANRAAGIAVTRPGAAEAMPTRGEIEGAE